MHRRKFIQLTATGTGGMLLLPHFLTAQHLWTAHRAATENVLVFIQLNGGNDGLNTFIPFDNPLYYFNRPTLGISKEKVTSTINGMGFHPALKDLATILQEGQLTVLQNVGYPEPNRSHFRSQEIWQTASSTNEYIDYGWLGRFLDIQCQDEILPSLNIDTVDNLALKAANANGMTVKDLNRIKNYATSGNELMLSDNPQLDFVRKLQFASLEGMDEINKALQHSQRFSASYANNPLSKNLEWIAKLIKGNLNSKVYYTALNGFDTHNNQLLSHQKQLTIMNDAVYSFYKDLKENHLLSRVTTVIFSEFGRRVKENGSGTDHGTAGPVFIIGGNNKGKIMGSNPNLSQLDKGDLIHEIDFRSVYATLLHDKFKFDPKLINIQQDPIRGLF
ncbi:DUF1501 domain-containing protein [Flavobacterium lacus]|nr:DUF1501 domain-containing protein [Flavobacterium lacus]